MRARLHACAAALLLGCAGRIDADAIIDAIDAGAPLPPAPMLPASAPFACDASARGAPDELARLTMTQYRNTLRDLTHWVLGDAADADAVLATLELDALPLDRRPPTPEQPRGSYRRLDQALDQAHVDATYRVASALGAALSAEQRLAVVAGACATDGDASNDEACLADFIQRFGARALRHPLDAEDASFYRVVYGSDPAPSPGAYADLITVILSAPEFLYKVEHGHEPVAGDEGSYEISAYELASRISYHFWQTLPDEELWRAAQDGSLLEPEVLAREVERLLGDPRAHAAMGELFADWLALEDVPAFDARGGDPVLAAFAGDDAPSAQLREEAIDEVLALLEHVVFVEPAGVEALLASELTFARGELARLYGVEPWDGAAAPAAGERAGLLTRAFFLLSGSASTRPIQRGVFVRRTLLCDALDPPPANASALLPAAHGPKTTRRQIEELTEQPGSGCAGCHASAINPLGFAFEGFDALARPRSEQRLFDAHGTLTGTLPIDTTSVPRITPDDARVSHGPDDVARFALESGKLEACLARHYFRFAFGRREDLARDGCALERLRARLEETGRIRDMLAEVALLTEMRQRRFAP